MTENKFPTSIRTLTQDDIKLIEAIIHDACQNSAVSIDRSLKRLEARIAELDFALPTDDKDLEFEASI